jgi:hypothetical protein
MTSIRLIKFITSRDEGLGFLISPLNRTTPMAYNTSATSLSAGLLLLLVYRYMSHIIKLFCGRSSGLVNRYYVFGSFIYS